jgi:hypothetical protein
MNNRSKQQQQSLLYVTTVDAKIFSKVESRMRTFNEAFFSSQTFTYSSDVAVLEADVEVSRKVVSQGYRGKSQVMAKASCHARERTSGSE